MLSVKTIMVKAYLHQKVNIRRSLMRFFWMVRYHFIHLFIYSLDSDSVVINYFIMSQEHWLKIHNVAQQYKIIEKVGRGTYGTVFKAKHLKTGQFVAIKKIQTKDPKLQAEGFPITALRQINLLKMINHRNVIKMREIIVSKPQKKNLFRGSTYLVFEYMDHDFSGLFRNKIKFTLSQIKCLMAQLLEGLKYLHDEKILHRDIKSANLLLNSRGELKIADFGLGRKFRPDFQYTSKVVTLWYRAPELLLGTKSYNQKVDLWSAGCILAEFLTGEILFKKQLEYAQIERIFEVVGGIEENNFSDAKSFTHYNEFKPKRPYPKQLSEIIRKMIPDIDDTTIDFLNGLLQLNPKIRFSTQQALRHPFFKEAPYPCKPTEIPKFQYQYHEMHKQLRPIEKPQKTQQKRQEQTKKLPPRFQNQRRYSYKQQRDYPEKELIKQYSNKQSYKESKEYGSSSNIKQYNSGSNIKQYNKDKDYYNNSNGNRYSSRKDTEYKDEKKFQSKDGTARQNGYNRENIKKIYSNNRQDSQLKKQYPNKQKYEKNYESKQSYKQKGEKTYQNTKYYNKYEKPNSNKYISGRQDYEHRQYTSNRDTHKNYNKEYPKKSYYKNKRDSNQKSARSRSRSRSRSNQNFSYSWKNTK